MYNKILHNRRAPRAQEQGGFHDFMAERDHSRSQEVGDHRNDSTNRASNPKRKSNPRGARSPVNSSTKGRDDVTAAPELERRPGTMRTVRLGTYALFKPWYGALNTSKFYFNHSNFNRTVFS